MDNLGSYIRDKIIDSAGQISLESISSETQYSTGYLSSVLSDKVGVCPKTFSKIIGFQNTVQLIDNDPNMNLTQISNINGYYDQSHFIKDLVNIWACHPKNTRKQSLNKIIPAELK